MIAPKYILPKVIHRFNEKERVFAKKNHILFLKKMAVFRHFRRKGYILAWWVKKCLDLWITLCYLISPPERFLRNLKSGILKSDQGRAY